MQNEGLTIHEVRGAVFGNGSMRGCRRDDHDDVRALQGLAHVHGGELDLAESLDLAGEGNPALVIDRVNRFLEDIVKSHGVSHESQMTGHRLSAVSSANDCPRK